MAGNRASVDGRVTLTRVEDFLANPPAGFSVEQLESGAHRVHSDPDQNLVLIDDGDSCTGRIVFHNSVGREFTAKNLWEYTSFRKSLLSKRIYLLVSVCEEVTKTKAAREARVLQQYVVCISDKNPSIKWQLEKGLDWAISSVAGESYRLDIDLIELLESWAQKNTQIISDKPIQGKPVWRDTDFTLKYNSDALFDFPHWFGFSKRRFKVGVRGEQNITPL